MRIAVVPDGEGGAALRRLDSDGLPAGPPQRVGDLASAVAELEPYAPRWVWAATDGVYPALLDAGVTVARCHDIALVEALLLGCTGCHGEPRSLGAAWARLRGREVPPDRGPVSDSGGQLGLFEPDRSTLPAGTDPLSALIEVHAEQLRRIVRNDRPGRFAMLAAVESAGALIAAEMAREGVPWSRDTHDAILTDQLGPRPPAGTRPPVLADLAERISAQFGRQVNPDSPAQLMKAFTAVGQPVASTRSWVLREVEHPVVPLLLRYKELARLHSAHGWAWLDTWVRDGRFRPDYVVGGVVSGRWATRGGGALQIPKILRPAVVADEGWTLVAADAGQLEPRILAAVSGDAGLAEAAGVDDLYERLAPAFGGDRQRAKIGLLAAMYGQTGGDAAPLLRTMRERFPRALDYVDSAARTGEEGGAVRSWLGRTSPSASPEWRESVLGSAGGARARERGRFTRNFVIQGTAAEWALVFMAAVRRRLAGIGRECRPDGLPRVVFFQHDEVVLHTPLPAAEAVVAALADAETETRHLLFGDTQVRFPLDVQVARQYAALPSFPRS